MSSFFTVIPNDPLKTGDTETAIRVTPETMLVRKDQYVCLLLVLTIFPIIGLFDIQLLKKVLKNG